MSLIVDAAPLVALGDRTDPLRPEVRRLLQEEPGDLVLPAPVAAEVDYMLGARLGHVARRAFLEDLAARRFHVACLEGDDYDTVQRLEAQYQGLNAGLADLSLVVLAHRYKTHRLLTFDERDFRTLRPLDGGHFTLLPRDR